MTKDSLIQKMQGFQKNYTEEVDPEFYVVEKCIDIIRQHENEVINPMREAINSIEGQKP